MIWFKKYIFPLSFIFLLTYVVCRAYLLSFTHDEALSYTMIFEDNIFIKTANHHFLNTQLMKLFSTLFGYSEFALRLPNVLAFVLYFIGFQLISKKIAVSFFAKLFLFSILFFNPFMLDYFALARGYGLSLGFLMLALWSIFNLDLWVLNPINYSYSLLFFSIFSALAMASNLVLINAHIVGLGFFVLIFCIMLRKKIKFSKYQSILVFLAFFIGLFALKLGIDRLLLLKELKELYIGADSYFGSIKSLAICFLYGKAYPIWIEMSLTYFYFGMFSIGSLSLLLKKDLQSNFTKISIVNVVFILGLFIENLLFEARFPIERSGLYIFPMFSFYLFFFIFHMKSNYNFNARNLKYLLLLPILFVSYNFIAGINFERTYGWGFDAENKKVANILKLYSRERNQKIMLSNNWLFEPSLNYYIKSQDINVFKINRSGVNDSSDFIYLLEGDSIFGNFKIIKEFPEIGTKLLKRKDFK